MSSSTAPSSTPSTSAPPSASTQPSSSTTPQSSPLLFFVALGFGVVFTNLWIIVGVKYCFRYNARNRARQQDENGEPIDLANMPPHRRRRREKKLMTIDEVNERFPITKYKTWVSNRAAQGLPTEGGVNQSRAASVRDAEGVIEPIGESSKSVVTADVASTTEHQEAQPSSPTKSSTPKESTEVEAKTTEHSAEQPPSEQEHSHDHAHGHDHDHDHDHNHSHSHDHDHSHGATAAATGAPVASLHSTEADDDAIPAAIPGAAEMLESPGDSCAICIDTLEEDEDVRGLSCGHAFHATCIDPWLTNRRACCPLCKTDFYVPKPRPEQNTEEGANPETGDQNPEQTQQQQQQQPPVRRPSMSAAMPASGIVRYVPRLTGRVDALPPERRQARSRPGPGENSPTEIRPTMGDRFTSVFRRNGAQNVSQQPQQQPAPEQTTSEPATESQPSQSRRWVPSLPNWRRGRAQNPEQATPGQLEAGNATNSS